MKTRTARILALAAATFATLPAKATEEKAWQFTFTPYAWMTNLDTTAGGDRISSDSTIHFGDLLSIIDAAWMSMFEARYGNWSVMNDIVYMKISDGGSPGSQLGFVSSNLDASFEEEAISVFVGYTPDNSTTTFFAGPRYLYVKAEADATIITPLPIGGFAGSGSRNEDWFDPTIGFRHIFPFNDQWQATLQMDVGGGVDSEFSSFNTLTFDYALSKDVNLQMGYRYARVDKDDHDLLFDQTAQGFLMAAAFRF